MVQAVLSVLGVSTEELLDLQKQATKASREENENLFAQNEYNYEMLTIFMSRFHIHVINFEHVICLKK